VYVKPTTPRSIGGILDDAIQLYRSAFAASWPLALFGQVMLAVPVFIIRAKTIATPVVVGNPLAALEVYKSPLVWVPYLIATILLLGVNNALISRADAIATVKAQTLGESLAVGFRLLPRTLLLGLAIVVAALIVGILAGIVGAFLGALLVAKVILISVLVVAAIYALWKIFLSNIAIVVEDAAVFKSLEISWTLIKDHWWRSATVYTVAIIMAMVFYVVLAFASGLVIGLMHGSPTMTVVLSELITLVGGTVLMAFLPAVMLTLYYDLKLRKDGADLASRVTALAQK
jgi:hypothetical protein